MEIVFSKHSEGVLHQGGKTFPYGHRSVFVYQPGKTHWVENAKAGEHLCMGVVGCRADIVGEGVRRASPAVVARFDEIRTTLQKADSLQATRLDLLAGLLVCDLLEKHPSVSRPPQTRAQRVRDTIETSLDNPPSLEELAKGVFVSREYLRQLFRKEFGESITSYIIRRRIELAAQILRNTKDPIKEVAWQSGFPNEYYFSRIFRKVMNCPPSEWRLSGGVSGEERNLE